MAFNKHKNMLKGISNVVEATSKEEQIHGDFGIDLIKILQKEHPEWFTPKYHEDIQNLCKQAFEAEAKRHGVTIKHYHADNGLFRSKNFKAALEKAGQTISYAGVGAHHQNGKAE